MWTCKTSSKKFEKIILNKSELITTTKFQDLSEKEKGKEKREKKNKKRRKIKKRRRSRRKIEKRRGRKEI